MSSTNKPNPPVAPSTDTPPAPPEVDPAPVAKSKPEPITTLTVKNSSKAPHYVCNTLVMPGQEAQIEAALLLAAYPKKRQKYLTASGIEVSAGKKAPETK